MIFPCVISCDCSSVPLFCCAWNPNSSTVSKDLKIFIFIIQYPSTEGLKSLIWSRGEKKWCSCPLFESHSLFFFALPPEVSYTLRSLKKNLMAFCWSHIILNIENPMPVCGQKEVPLGRWVELEPPTREPSDKNWKTWNHLIKIEPLTMYFLLNMGMDFAGRPPPFLSFARLGERWWKSWLHSLRRANIYDPKVSWEHRHRHGSKETRWDLLGMTSYPVI